MANETGLHAALLELLAAAKGCEFDLTPHDGPIARLALFMHERGDEVVAALARAEESKARDGDSFTHGYLIAVANIMNLHGDDVIAADVLQEGGASPPDIKRLGLTDYDARPLRKLFRKLAGRRAMALKKAVQ